ncbi:MAG: sorbosone dehydrogenase family protein [Chloroflexi bacterium]|nr:sorbosone dehydrogenase family protein [Chloroflexota bacterium]
MQRKPHRHRSAATLIVAAVAAGWLLAAPAMTDVFGVSTAVAQTGKESTLRLPPGFQIDVFARGLTKVRFMTVGPEGDLYASLFDEGRVVRLPDRDGDGRSDRTHTFVDGLKRPHGLAFHAGYLYIAEEGRLSRAADTNGDGVANRPETLAELPSGDGHSTRTVGFGPDGMLYVSIGSSKNVVVETDQRRATIMQFAPDGSGGRVFARGLRNSVGFVFHPTSGELWATNNGRDLLGDEYPPETINVARDGDDFGWPHCINGAEPDPEFGYPGACDGVTRPAIEMQPHSAPLGLAFYDGSQFPEEYRGDLFVAFHGSWNRSEQTGYKLVRIRMRDGQPTGEIEDFVVGWIDEKPAWGRPVDVRVGHDGALYVSDDKNGQIYRISYVG